MRRPQATLATRQLLNSSKKPQRRTPIPLPWCADKEQLTYGELNTRANQLAHRLRELGVGSEAMVGCCMERSIELIIAMVAVLKAGGAYVPLDPAYPKERFNLLLEDTRTQVMLTQQSIASTLFVDYANTCLVVDALPRLSGPVEQIQFLSEVPRASHT